MTEYLIGALFGIAIGGLIAFFVWRIAQERIRPFDETKAELEKARNDLEALRIEIAKVDERLKASEESEMRMREAFKALSADTLEAATKSFLDLAEQRFNVHQEKSIGELEQRKQAVDSLVKPINESVGKVQQHLHDLETKREGAYSALQEQVKAMMDEARRLSGALKSPTSRGNWGEVQLRRTVELAGMTNYCDFEEQSTFDGTDRRLRPDMIVKMPNGRVVAVDAKTPLSSFMEAFEAKDEEERARLIKQHAQQVRSHVASLSKKEYWDAIGQTPEFVVLFLPGEVYYNAALEQDPSLIEFGAEKKVLIATPPSLIGLLKAVAYGWSQRLLEENVREISNAGKELYDRLRTMANHLHDVGKKLNGAAESYNTLVGSYQTRALVSARKLKELGVASKTDLPDIPPIDTQAREIEP
ncbi:MAG: DNA recombination protein RmuC [Armatimonadetes bacterium]|nr:DNA recombination protein RmuC [Armatimonadota bacterium]